MRHSASSTYYNHISSRIRTDTLQSRCRRRRYLPRRIFSRARRPAARTRIQPDCRGVSSARWSEPKTCGWRAAGAGGQGHLSRRQGRTGDAETLLDPPSTQSFRQPAAPGALSMAQGFWFCLETAPAVKSHSLQRNTIRYDTTEKFNLDSKAECDQLKPLMSTVAILVQL